MAKISLFVRFFRSEQEAIAKVAVEVAVSYRDTEFRYENGEVEVTHENHLA